MSPFEIAGYVGATLAIIIFLTVLATRFSAVTDLEGTCYEIREPYLYTIMLLEKPAVGLHGIQAVRGATGLGIKEAKGVINKEMPQVILSGISAQEVNDACNIMHDFCPDINVEIICNNFVRTYSLEEWRK